MAGGHANLFPGVPPVQGPNEQSHGLRGGALWVHLSDPLALTLVQRPISSLYVYHCVYEPLIAGTSPLQLCTWQVLLQYRTNLHRPHFSRPLH